MNIEELKIGMWVSERLAYSKDAPRYSMPMQVEGIFKDGTVYLNFDDNEGDIFECNVKDLVEVKDYNGNTEI